MTNNKKIVLLSLGFMPGDFFDFVVKIVEICIVIIFFGGIIKVKTDEL